jgi:hypothetical protein
MEKYSQEMLEDIQLDAKHGLSLRDIAMRLNIPVSEFLDDYWNVELLDKSHYDTGRTQGTIEVDSAIFKLAANNSHSAQETYKKRLLASRIENKIQELDKF